MNEYFGLGLGLDRNQSLAVDSISLKGTLFLGSIQVRNFDFRKNVTVRFTFDMWKSFEETVATFHSCLIEKDSTEIGLDKFTFCVPLDQWLLPFVEDMDSVSDLRLSSLIDAMDDKIHMYFAVRYEVGGKVYWDNNNGMNHLVEFRKTQKKAAPISIPTSPHFALSLNNLGSQLASPSSSPVRSATLTSFASRYSIADSLSRQRKADIGHRTARIPVASGHAEFIAKMIASTPAQLDPSLGTLHSDNFSIPKSQQCADDYSTSYSSHSIHSRHGYEADYSSHFCSPASFVPTYGTSHSSKHKVTSGFDTSAFDSQRAANVHQQSISPNRTSQHHTILGPPYVYTPALC